jgi:hypothetical protein
MNTPLRFFIGLTLAVLLYQGARAEHLSSTLLVTARLDGGQVVPPVDEASQGVASFTITPDRRTVIIQIDLVGLTSPAFTVDIRNGIRGANGQVVLNLTPFVTGGKRISTAITGNDLAKLSMAKLLSGGYYLHVGTPAHPNGELRGQLMLETDNGFRALLDGSQETPPVATPARGLALLNLTSHDNIMSIHVVTSGLSGSITGAHLHRAVPGESGPVVLDLMSLVNGNTINGSIRLPDSIFHDLDTGNLYVNIHTAEHPAGEIRGQVLLDSGIAFDAMLTGESEVPPVTTTASALAAISLNPAMDTLRYTILADGLSGAITAAHFHRAPVGINAPALIGLPVTLTPNVVEGIVTGADLTPQFINDLLTGNIYVNLHTGDHAGGEVRGQVYRLAREGYVLLISGTQEVPPVFTNAIGGGFVSIDRNQTNARYMMVAGGFNSNVTGIHFHLGSPGTNSDILKHLTSQFKDSTLFGIWKSTDSVAFTPAIARLFRDNEIYVNFHTVATPRGEARGNIVRTSSFTEGRPDDPMFTGNLVFGAELTGRNASPPVTTPAHGLAAFSLNARRDSLFVSITVDGLSGPVTRVMMQTNEQDTSLRVKRDLTAYFAGNRASFVLTGSDVLPNRLAPLFSNLFSTAYTITVATAQNPAGEVAGTLVKETDYPYMAQLDGIQEVPPLPNVSARGLASIVRSRDSSRLFIQAVFNGLSGPITGAHLHYGFAGESGPAAIDLMEFVHGNIIDAAIDSVTISQAVMSQGGIYINVHTEQHPNGEIRGQVLDPLLTPTGLPAGGITFEGMLSPSQEVPPTPSSARGLAVMTLNRSFDTVYYAIFLSGLTGQIEEVLLHHGRIGEAGKILADLPFTASNNQATGKHEVANATVLAIPLRMIAGETYVSIKTKTFPNGELRGQLFRVARDGYAFDLCGAQEVSPVNTPATGTGIVSIDRHQTNAHYMVQATRLSGAITDAHFHRGVTGEQGPAVKGVAQKFNGTFADGYWSDSDTGIAFTTAHSRAIKNDSIYFNIHTAANPGGEIRGQVANDARCETGVASVVVIPPAMTEGYAYPNPASRMVTITFESLNNYTATAILVDMQGRIVAGNPVQVGIGSNSMEFDVESLVSGTYLVKLERNGETVLVQKVVKE